jgi:exodeoxyribonuclease V alpha subunit
MNDIGKETEPNQKMASPDVIERKNQRLAKIYKTFKKYESMSGCDEIEYEGLVKKYSPEHVYVLDKCLATLIEQTGNIGIPHMQPFLACFEDLTQNPYMKTLEGGSISVRDMIMKMMKTMCEKNKMSANVPLSQYLQSVTSLQAARVDVYVWLLWQKHKSLTYLPKNIMIKYLQTLPSLLPPTTIKSAEGRLALDLNTYESVVQMNELCCPEFIYQCEQNIREFIHNATVLKGVSCDTEVELGDEGSIELDSTQTQIIKNIVKSPVSIIQGGAGVGKTTTMAALVETILCSNMGTSVTVQCVAFTHKAKKCLLDRMCQQPPRAAAMALGATQLLQPYIKKGTLRINTIHSFILTLKNKGIPQDHDVFIIIDESSMVDLEILSEMSVALNNIAGHKYQVVFVGDVNQLPPVGRGEVFRNLIENNKPGGHVQVYGMSHCYRTSFQQLCDAYNNIRDGVMPLLTGSQFWTNLFTTDKQVMSHVDYLIQTQTTNQQTCPVFITWQNKDVDCINIKIQDHMLATRRIGPEQCGDFYKGDIVMYIGENETCDGSDLTNATMGRVMDVEKQGGTVSMVVSWQTEQGSMNRTYKRTSKGIRDVRLAYCMTVHKSQGSEYKNVVVVCVNVNKMSACLDRRWLYTAVSRGKEQVTLVSTNEIEVFIKNPVRASEPLFIL